MLLLPDSCTTCPQLLAVLDEAWFWLELACSKSNDLAVLEALQWALDCLPNSELVRRRPVGLQPSSRGPHMQLHGWCAAEHCHACTCTVQGSSVVHVRKAMVVLFDFSKAAASRMCTARCHAATPCTNCWALPLLLCS
jgi:hypothetical protein